MDDSDPIIVRSLVTGHKLFAPMSYTALERRRQYISDAAGPTCDDLPPDSIVEVR